MRHPSENGRSRVSILELYGQRSAHIVSKCDWLNSESFLTP